MSCNELSCLFPVCPFLIMCVVCSMTLCGVSAQLRVSSDSSTRHTVCMCVLSLSCVSRSSASHSRESYSYVPYSCVSCLIHTRHRAAATATFNSMAFPPGLFLQIRHGLPVSSAEIDFALAVCCSVLQCVAVCCSVLQCVAVCCSVLQCAAVRCSDLQCAHQPRILGLF